MTLKISPQQLRNWKFPLLWVLAGILLVNHFVSIATNITLINNNRLDVIQVFSADKMHFSEWRSRKKYARPEENPQVLTFNVPLQKNNCLRIDPSAAIGEVHLISIEFSTPFNIYRLQANEIYDLFQPVHHIQKWTLDADAAVVFTSGNDSQLVTCQLDQSAIGQLKKDILNIKSLILLLIIVLSIMDGWFNMSSRFFNTIKNEIRCRGRLFGGMMVFISLLVVLYLICHVAITSRYNVHPDERMHNLAASYYENHWLPPNLDDPAVQLLYLKSGWGVSYLSHLDLSYLFAAKFRTLIRTIVEDRYLGLRIFNIALFLAVITCAYTLGQSFILTILLISPQIWYIFSYFNGDAFPLGLSIISGTILLKIRNYEVAPKSIFAEPAKIVPLILGLGLVIGLLALAKRNYLIFIGFLLFYFLWRIIFATKDNRKQLSLILISSTLIGLTLFSSVKGLDTHINGTQKK